MTLAAITNQRLYQQGLSRAGFETVEAVVAWLGAVQAQEYPASLWALGLRLPHLSVQDIEQMVTGHSIVRTWPMRGTIHFMPAADAKWMVELMAGRGLNKLKPIILKQHGIDDAMYKRAEAAGIKALQGGRALTRPALYEAMEAAGVSTSNGKGLFLSTWMAHEGVICFGPREGKQPLFVLLDEWVTIHNRPSREEALAILARRYFTSHGPATLQDFVWWTGLLSTDAKAGIDSVKSDLIEETIEGKTYWRARTAASEPKAASPTAYLIPSFDEYFVSYKDRNAGLERAHQHEVYPNAMMVLNTVIVVDGQLVGTWKRTLHKDRVEMNIAYLVPVTEEERAAVDMAVQRYGEFLGLPVAC